MVRQIRDPERYGRELPEAHAEPPEPLDAESAAKLEAACKKQVGCLVPLQTWRRLKEHAVAKRMPMSQIALAGIIQVLLELEAGHDPLQGHDEQVQR